MVWGFTYLCSKDLTIVLGAVEQYVTPVIHRVPHGNETVDMERPLKTSFDLGNLNRENLHGVVMDTPEARTTRIRVPHGSKTHGCNKNEE